MSKSKNYKGFTIIELIVVMAIVAVLVGLSILGISTVQTSGRNTARLQYASTIVAELESHYGNNGSYPAKSTAGLNMTAGTGAVTIGTRTILTLEGPGLPNFSASSATATDYCYSVTNGGASYSFGVQLENGNAEYFGQGPNCTITATTF